MSLHVLIYKIVFVVLRLFLHIILSSCIRWALYSNRSECCLPWLWWGWGLVVVVGAHVVRLLGLAYLNCRAHVYIHCVHTSYYVLSWFHLDFIAMISSWFVHQGRNNSIVNCTCQLYNCWPEAHYHRTYVIWQYGVIKADTTHNAAINDHRGPANPNVKPPSINSKGHPTKSCPISKGRHNPSGRRVLRGSHDVSDPKTSCIIS